MINAADGDFSMYRRFVLAVAMKVDDREKSENLTAAGGAGEKEVNEVTAMSEAVEEEEVDRATTDDEIVVSEGGVAIAKPEYLAKASSTALMIIAFSS